MSEIAENIKRLVEQSGMSQKEFAAMCGISEQALSGYVHAEREPRLSSAARMAERMEITLDEMAGLKKRNGGMTLNDYGRAAWRTQNHALTHAERLDHAKSGMAAEVGEIHSIFQKAYQGHPINADDVKKELGDLLWFVSEFADEMGFTLEEVAQRNVDKLWKRFPTGFDSVRSVNREE